VLRDRGDFHWTANRFGADDSEANEAFVVSTMKRAKSIAS